MPKPVVYAVEDEYQIVWQTAEPTAGWVQVGGTQYANSAGGLLRVGQTHKVRVPIASLNAAGAYTLVWQSVQDHRSYSATKGERCTSTVAFRAAHMQSDGLCAYMLADVHGRNDDAVAAAGYWRAKLGLLLLLGDVAELNRPQDLSQTLELAHRITQGQIPVMYARGNHDTRGGLAAQLHHYVGAPSADQYYYATRLGSVWFCVCDAGEDKPDAHREYSGLVDFTSYRQREMRALQALAAGQSYAAPGITHRLLLSHIPLGYLQNTPPEAERELFALVNAMPFSLALFGHEHTTCYYAPGTYARPEPRHRFPFLIGANPDGAHMWGTALRLLPGGGTELFCTNEQGEAQAMGTTG